MIHITRDFVFFASQYSMEFNVSYFSFHGIPVISPGNLVIHFQHHIVHRFLLLSDAGEVIDSLRYRELSDQRSEFIPKNLLLYDINEACQILYNMVSRFSDDAHISFDCSSLIQEIMNASLVVAGCRVDEGIEVSIDTINDHVRAVEVGDGMVPAEETAARVKALLDRETAGVEGDGAACIGCWLENSHYCPICRYLIPPVT